MISKSNQFIPSSSEVITNFKQGNEEDFDDLEEVIELLQQPTNIPKFTESKSDQQMRREKYVHSHILLIKTNGTVSDPRIKI